MDVFAHIAMYAGCAQLAIYTCDTWYNTTEGVVLTAACPSTRTRYGALLDSKVNINRSNTIKYTMYVQYQEFESTW